MNRLHNLTISDKRQKSQMGLDTYALNKDNILDYPVDKLILDIKNKIKTELEEHERWINLQDNDPERFKELEELANLTGDSLYRQMYSYIQNASSLEDELLVLFEMKIIYAFKHLEINIKKLLFSAYDDPYINRQFKWDTIIQFLQSKKINAKDLNAYEEINQLRNLNNTLKHSDREIDQFIKNIPEFKDKELISFIELELFYKRIKKAPSVFLDSMVSAIFKDLYTFDHDRIVSMATSLALRMEKKDADVFCEELFKLYDQDHH